MGQLRKRGVVWWIRYYDRQTQATLADLVASTLT